jgi:hypothetical protein
VLVATQQIKDEDQILLHGVDAQRAVSNKELKKKVPLDRIMINFPHVGGILKCG